MHALHSSSTRPLAAGRQAAAGVRCRKLQAAPRCQVARPRGSKGDEAAPSPPETLAQGLVEPTLAEGAPVCGGAVAAVLGSLCSAPF